MDNGTNTQTWTHEERKKHRVSPDRKRKRKTMHKKMKFVQNFSFWLSNRIIKILMLFVFCCWCWFFFFSSSSSCFVTSDGRRNNSFDEREKIHHRQMRKTKRKEKEKEKKKKRIERQHLAISSNKLVSNRIFHCYQSIRRTR